jgi:hypothetical protein
MKPKPFSSLNHFTVPVAIAGPPVNVLRHAEDAGQLLRTARTAFAERAPSACLHAKRAHDFAETIEELAAGWLPRFGRASPWRWHATSSTSATTRAIASCASSARAASAPPPPSPLPSCERSRPTSASGRPAHCSSRARAGASIAPPPGGSRAAWPGPPQPRPPRHLRRGRLARRGLRGSQPFSAPSPRTGPASRPDHAKQHPDRLTDRHGRAYDGPRSRAPTQRALAVR